MYKLLHSINYMPICFISNCHFDPPRITCNCQIMFCVALVSPGVSSVHL